MKQTLLRILLTDWFGVETREGVTHVGVGFLLLPWLVLGVYEYLAARRAGQTLKDQRRSLLEWSIVAVAILLVPTFAARLPIQTLPVFGWGFMMILGFLAATFLTGRRFRQIGLTTELSWNLSILLLVAGILGARAFYLIQYHRRIFSGAAGLGDVVRRALNFMDGGMVLFGGLLLGAAAFFVWCARKKVSPLVIADSIIPAVFLGLVFGRLGCLLNGCCYGDACELPWGMRFPQGSPPWQAAVNLGWNEPGDPRSIPLHPTQIYSAINALLLTFLTWSWFRHRRRDGEAMALGLLTYPIARITIEFLRSDEAGQFGTPFTISQWISAVLFLIGVLLWRRLPRKLTPLPLVLAAPKSAPAARGRAR